MASVGEREGMTFEQRCAGALAHLRLSRATSDGLAESEMRETQREQSTREASLEGFSPEVRGFLRQFAEEIAQVPIETGAKLRETLWEHSMKTATTLFGEDAVRFALATLKRERPGN